MIDQWCQGHSREKVVLSMWLWLDYHKSMVIISRTCYTAYLDCFNRFTCYFISLCVHYYLYSLKSSLCIENKENLVDFVVTFHFLLEFFLYFWLSLFLPLFLRHGIWTQDLSVLSPMCSQLSYELVTEG